jgi:uncharacterized protein YaiL (DUF2058 family)
MQSLKDKLMKAGLVSEETAKKLDERPPIDAPQAPPMIQFSAPRSRPTSEVRLPKFAPMAGTKEANRQASRAQLEVDRKIREQVENNKVEPQIGASTFHFVTRKNKLRRLELTEDQHKQLEDGILAIVEWPQKDKLEHALVPTSIAQAIKALSPRAVRFLKGEESVGFEDDADHHTDLEKTAPEPAATFITVKRKPMS